MKMSFSRLKEIHERISPGKSRPMERFEEGIGLSKHFEWKPRFWLDTVPTCVRRNTMKCGTLVQWPEVRKR